MTTYQVFCPLCKKEASLILVHYIKGFASIKCKEHGKQNVGIYNSECFKEIEN